MRTLKRICLANLLTLGTNDFNDFAAQMVRDGRAYALETFWKKREITRTFERYPDVKILLDSGAHSLLNAQTGLIEGKKVGTEKKDNNKEVTFSPQDFAQRLSPNQQAVFSQKMRGTAQLLSDYSFSETKEVKEYLDDYIAFIHKHQDNLWGYVNLDIIYNAEMTWKNQKYMEDHGLKPIPVFHYGEDFDWLKFYVDNYEYIGIGGVATGITKKQFVQSLGDRAFDYIAKNNPMIKVHGFAVTSHDLMKRYLFYSVDSTTWVITAGHGMLMCPKYDNSGECSDFATSPLMISVSEMTALKKCSAINWRNKYTLDEQNAIIRYVKSIGLNIDKMEKDHYERWKAGVYYFENVMKYGKFDVDTSVFAKTMSTFF